MTREIRQGKKVFAIVVDSADFAKGAHPVTNPSEALQLLVMKRPKGHIVSKHMHRRIMRSIPQTQEALIVLRGAVRATIYNRAEKKLGVCTVGARQCLLILDGAHILEFTKDTVAYECKIGPHVDDKIML